MYKDDRRTFERFMVGFSAELKHLGAEELNPAQCRDVSANGVGLFSEEKLIPDIHLEVCLGVPDGGEPFRGKARVVWCQQVQHNRWRSGLELKTVDFMRLRRALSL
jgi:hypothetical protein